MINVVESIGKPIRFLSRVGCKYIPGKIVSLDAGECIEYNGGIPFGICLSVEYGLILVHSDRMIFRTDMYDKRYHEPYVTGTKLYVNEKGILTSKRIMNQVSVGKVISYFDGGVLEVIWH